ncbi:hypothetical protein PMG71_11745 [Roseofilum sp. BLCC_M154]|uniref:Uncharacterized protein n=1 Tax=Roseofilum acuticapitatum BLCC-M154 TaxID=3022444 RepID=A0ABT7AT65_9CYAN|nr:hypothetical protein [Roseofilum acuticapitatum]MDJ1170102.1 hypothetical protein [Roseofilum acuticapitatum BLCC-M154]
MQHIKEILANMTANSLSVHHEQLPAMVEKAIATSQVPVHTLGYSLIWHVPATQLSAAQPHIHGLIEPYCGYNASLSDGNWFDRKNNRWCPEPIVLVKSYMTGDVLQQHLPTTLQRSYSMGKALEQSAIALEIIPNNLMLTIPTDD